MKEEVSKGSTKTYLETRGYKDSSRTDMLLFKFGTWLYRKTGFLISYVRNVQDDFIRKNTNKMLENWMEDRKEEKERYFLSFSNFVSCEIGCWQAHHRICRKYNPTIMKMSFKIGAFLRKHRIM